MKKEEMLDQVATLYPYLDFTQRYEWVKRLETVFDLEFPEMTKLLIEKVNEKEKAKD